MKKNKKTCSHQENGKSSVIFDKKRWFGIEGKKYFGVCKLCGKQFSFSELVKAVEQAVDIIPILPQFKFRPNDALDFNIWCYINYVRDAKGLPACDYKDIYGFYDRKKKEYIEQYGDPYGIFTNDTTENNRDNIKKFILIPNEYKEVNILNSESGEEYE